MKYSDYAIQEVFILQRVAQDFLAAWMELARLFEIMDRKGFTKEEKNKVLETALKVAIEQAPGEGTNEAAERVKKLLAS
ncbi:MAG TPA: hypothetical protein VMU36_00695 [Spirochaetia bacterium]|nr:hypothetical protein [Spirochaetia bacterium]